MIQFLRVRLVQQYNADMVEFGYKRVYEEAVGARCINPTLVYSGPKIEERSNQYGLHSRKQDYIQCSYLFLLRQLLAWSRKPHNEFRFTSPHGEYAKRCHNAIAKFNRSSFGFRLMA